MNDGILLNDDIISNQNNNLWNTLREEAWKKRIPIHGHFEITPLCNLDCKMCYVHLLKSQMNNVSELAIDEWKKIADDAIKNGMIFASISGGECLTSSYFDDFYLYLKSKGIIIFVLTNGVLLSNKMDMFCDYPPALIQVSMYGYDEDSYERVTGHRKYGVVSQSILRAKDHGINISVAVTASKLLPNVYSIVRKYYELGIGVTVNSWLIPPYSSTGRLLDDFKLSPEEQVSISEEIQRASNKETLPPYIGDLPKPNIHSDKIHKGLLCAAGRSDFSINWKGEMSLCVSMNDVTGEPLKDGFQKAWKDTVTVADNYLMPAECFGCDYIGVCNRCPAYHKIKGKDGHCNPDICKEGMLMVKRGIKYIK